jgi:hypothetical protein
MYEPCQSNYNNKKYWQQLTCDNKQSSIHLAGLDSLQSILNGLAMAIAATAIVATISQQKTG